MTAFTLLIPPPLPDTSTDASLTALTRVQSCPSADSVLVHLSPQQDHCLSCFWKDPSIEMDPTRKACSTPQTPWREEHRSPGYHSFSLVVPRHPDQATGPLSLPSLCVRRDDGDLRPRHQGDRGRHNMGRPKDAACWRRQQVKSLPFLGAPRSQAELATTSPSWPCGHRATCPQRHPSANTRGAETRAENGTSWGSLQGKEAWEAKTPRRKGAPRMGLCRARGLVSQRSVCSHEIRR